MRLERLQVLRLLLHLYVQDVVELGLGLGSDRVAVDLRPPRLREERPVDNPIAGADFT
jgi:hypothetical protein